MPKRLSGAVAHKPLSATGGYRYPLRGPILRTQGQVPASAVRSYATIGGISRLFESPKVRNILIKAKTMKAGSDGMQKLGMQFNDLLRASLQANPLKGTTEFERELSEAANAEVQEGQQ